MDNSITGITNEPAKYAMAPKKPRLLPQALRVPHRDSVSFGQNGEVSAKQAAEIVYERALARIRSVVTEAREQLGLPEDAAIDTSPEATAGRIADFAIGQYGKWRENHADLADDEARAQFSAFIGKAIGQGIDEARGILTALNALSPEVGTGIDTIASLVQERLDKFAQGED